MKGEGLTQRSREAEGRARRPATAASAIPPLRFKGFDGAWEESRFCEFATVRRGLTYSPMDCAVDGVRVLRSSNIEEAKFVLHSDDVVVNKSAAGIEPVKNGDILITAANGSSQLVGKHALVEGVADGAAVHGGFMLLASSSESGFLNAAMSAPWYRDFIATKMMGGNGALGNLGRDAFEELKFTVPQDRKERGEIGAAFREIDALIAAREEALGKLGQFKKAMLEKMFPRMDVSHGGTETRRCRVPELRFKGFDGEWEEKRVGELGRCQAGEGFPENEQGGKIGTPFFKVSDMNLFGNERQMVSANNFVTEEQIARNGWHVVNSRATIFFAKVGAAVLLNRKRLVHKPFLLDNNTMAFIINEADSDFMLATFLGIDMSLLTQTGTLPSISPHDVDDYLIATPSLPEQRKIGAYFRSLDALLSARREEIGKLKDLKKALLERMFV